MCCIAAHHLGDLSFTLHVTAVVCMCCAVRHHNKKHTIICVRKAHNKYPAYAHDICVRRAHIYKICINMNTVLASVSVSVSSTYIMDREIDRSILSYPILSYAILSYPILCYPILCYPIISYPILSSPFCILSYPILSYPILSILSYPSLSILS